MADDESHATESPSGDLKVDGDSNRRRVTALVAAGIVALLAVLYSCVSDFDDDDDSDPVDEFGSGEETELGGAESDGEVVPDDGAPTGTVKPPVPDHLKVATPVGNEVKDTSTMVVDFEGDARALDESGDLAIFQVVATAEDGSAFVSLYCVTEEGVPSNSAVRNEAADAVATEDGQGTVTQGIGGSLECTWTAPDSLTMTVTGFELPEAASTSVSVSVQESGSGEWVTIGLDEPAG